MTDTEHYTDKELSEARELCIDLGIDAPRPDQRALMAWILRTTVNAKLREAREEMGAEAEKADFAVESMRSVAQGHEYRKGRAEGLRQGVTILDHSLSGDK